MTATLAEAACCIAWSNVPKSYVFASVWIPDHLTLPDLLVAFSDRQTSNGTWIGHEPRRLVCTPNTSGAVWAYAPSKSTNTTRICFIGRLPHNKRSSGVEFPPRRPKNGCRIVTHFAPGYDVKKHSFSTH